MTPERYDRIGELFDGALELPSPERAAYLDHACVADEELRRAVIKLLANHEEATGFLSPPSSGTKSSTPAPNSTGDSIGPYQIQRQLGEGGMGTVYLAFQTDPIRREVALKVIRPGMGSRAVVARFESERRALALMDHSNIAQVFDAGATAQGLPYFVMEFVDGLPITRYCEEHKLNVRQRIELFVPVCHAIHHAHQKGIIHRDIKPSNVLVKEMEGHPIPKVIDFGLAKALDPDLSGQSLMTHAGMILGTLQYMSPEQAASGSRDIDTRSDVYSLGALLYELLTGTTPLDAQQLAEENYHALLQRVCDQEPVPPSIRRRETASFAAGPPLDQELDWIPLKALEKERDRRYDSVNGMVRDLERYLAGEPVEAAPPSQAYRLRKFVRRHRASFVVASAFLVVLLAAVVVSTSLAVRANRAEQEASAVNAFLRSDVLAQADPSNQAKPNVQPDPNLTVRKALDRAAGNIGGKFRGQPLAEAAIRETIASAYLGLAAYPKAEEQAKAALELRRRSLGENDRLTLRSRQMLAHLVSVQGRYREAEPLFADVFHSRRERLGAEDPDTLESMAALAQSYRLQGKFEPAIELFRDVIGKAARVLGPEHPDTVNAMSNLGATYFEVENSAQAEALQTKVLEIRQRTLGPEHPDTLRVMTSLAATYDQQRRFAEEEVLHRRSLAIQRRVNGVPHPDTLVTMYNLASLLTNQGRYPEALALLEENRAARGKIYPPDHPRTLRLLVNLSDLYARVGRHTEQVQLLEEAMAGQKRVLGNDHPDTLKTMVALADAYGGSRLAAAEPLAREAWKSQRIRFGLGHRYTVEALVCLSGVLLPLGRSSEMEPALREALAAVVGTDSASAFDRWRVMSMLGAVLTAQHRGREAEPLLLNAYEGVAGNSTGPAEVDDLRAMGQRVADCYKSMRQPAKAAQWRHRMEVDIQRLKGKTPAGLLCLPPARCALSMPGT